MSAEDSLDEQQLHQEALEDYLNAFPDALQEIERCIHSLTANPGSANEVNTLFRCLHTVKSNADMCQLPKLVEITRPLEDLVGSIRAGSLRFTASLGEVILMVLDRIHQAAQNLREGRALEPLRLEAISSALRACARANNETCHGHTQLLMELISGQPILEARIVPHQAETDIVCIHASEAQQADLRFFRQLSLSLENRSPFWEGRTGRLLRMAVETNEAAGKPTDPVQLEAAVYLHDLGMGFLSESILNKQGKLNELELRELRRHPEVGAGLLERMPGWEEAAEIVLQHHEKLDGGGYPFGVRDHQISHGAKLLAILDAFEAMTHQRIDRHHKKSILRAISELNACDTQFHPDWVKSFNKVVRRLLGGD